MHRHALTDQPFDSYFNDWSTFVRLDDVVDLRGRRDCAASVWVRHQLGAGGIWRRPGYHQRKFQIRNE